MPPTSAPWWGVPVVAGSFALGGALITLLVQAVRDRKQYNLRWQQELRKVCAEFLAAAEAVSGAARASDEGQFTKIFDDAEVCARSLQLIAPEEVIAVGMDTLEAAHEVWGTAARGEDVEIELKVAIMRAYLEKRRLFVEQCRVALGVPPIQIGRTDNP